jgi:hypothetical protein
VTVPPGEVLSPTAASPPSPNGIEHRRATVSTQLPWTPTFPQPQPWRALSVSVEAVYSTPRRLPLLDLGHRLGSLRDADRSTAAGFGTFRTPGRGRRDVLLARSTCQSDASELAQMIRSRIPIFTPPVHAASLSASELLDLVNARAMGEALRQVTLHIGTVSSGPG